MTSAPRTWAAAARLLPVVAGAALLAGCGGPEPASQEAAFTLSGANTDLALAVTDVGNVLVGQDGRTLYATDAAGLGPCVDACAQAWPPYVAEGVPAPADGAYNGLATDRIGTVQRPDGTMQVTYHDRPLHYHPGDAEPGVTAGQGLTEFDRTWGAVSAGGALVVR